VQKQNYHLSAQFQWRNGHALPKEKSTGIGRAPLDVDSTLYTSSSNDKGSVVQYTFIECNLKHFSKSVWIHFSRQVFGMYYTLYLQATKIMTIYKQVTTIIKYVVFDICEYKKYKIWLIGIASIDALEHRIDTYVKSKYFTSSG